MTLTPSFSGSGTIATISFKVTSTGNAALALDAEFATRGADGSISLVEPLSSVDLVAAVIPEFPALVLILALLIAGSVTVVSVTKLNRRK